MDLKLALQSQDARKRNEALKILYLDTAINAKIREWSKFHNLKNKEPDDILQDGIILLDKKVRNGSFKGESNVKTYLLGICKRLIWDSVKKKEILDFQDDFQDGLNTPSYDHFDDLEQSNEEKERDTALNKLIEQMDGNCPEALKNYYFERMSMTEVAEKIGWKNSNQAKKAVSRCRKKLRIVITNHPVLSNLLNL